MDSEDFGKGGVAVESEYDLELRISGKAGRREGMGYLRLLTVPNTARW